MKAIFDQVINVSPAGEQCLWRVESYTRTPATHVVTSSVNRWLTKETMAFWANAVGEIVDWDELASAGAGKHVACLMDAGFAVEV